MEEVRGALTTATLVASFLPLKASRSSLEHHRDAFSFLKERDLFPRSETTLCRAYKVPKGMQTSDDEERRAQYLDAGRLYFGGGFLEEIPQEASGRYYKELSLNQAATLYSVKAEGSTEVPGFEMALNFPEAMKQVTIGDDEVDEAQTLKKGEPIRLGWAVPALSKNDHLVMLELYSDADPSNLFFIRCLTEEVQTVQGAGSKWMIDPKYLSVLPATPKADLFLSRFLVRQAANAVIQVETQGMQTQYTQVAIE
jgi:hypothetical protein